jgi:hypothetical protein
MFAFLTKLLLVARSRLNLRARLEAGNLVLCHSPSILNAITVVKPETVIRWYRRGFRTYSRWKAADAVAAQDRPRDPQPYPTDEQGEPL